MRQAKRESELFQPDRKSALLSREYETGEKRDFLNEPRGLSDSRNGVHYFSVHTEESIVGVDFCVIEDDKTEHRWELEPIKTEGGSLLYIGTIPELPPGTRYGLRTNHTDNPASSNHLLLDPYARASFVDDTGQVYGVVPELREPNREIIRPVVEPKDRIIYETHIKGATMLHPDVPDDLRGTYEGFSHPAHVGYLKSLGITSVEILPIMQSIDEPHLRGLGKTNYWGYNPANYFAPHSEYARNPEKSISELKSMIDRLHAENLEVILDVVYNHTADSGETTLNDESSIVSLRGLDERYYHTHIEDGYTKYHNFSGCGNAVNASAEPGHKMILDSLHYWSDEIGVDGFRFDLAATLIRDKKGWVNPHTSSFLRAIREDESLRRRILIAEPWDIGDYGYARGKFAKNLQNDPYQPDEPQWQEWSDTFRDVIRRWNLGEATAGELASVLADPHDTINFITAHDGFTLWDLVSYNHKHNEANGENNRDGSDNNHSNNHGIEGPTDNPHINAARKQAVRNMILTLLMTTGTPMINGGDEYNRTQGGNNNAYCQDNEITWHDWERAEIERAMVDFVIGAITIHKRSGVGSPSLKRNMGTVSAGRPNEKGIDWVNLWGHQMTGSDWDGRLLGRYTSGQATGTGESTLFYANGLAHDVIVSLPVAPSMHGEYELLADAASGRIDQEGIGIVPERFIIKAMSSVVLRRREEAASVLPRLSGDLLADTECL